MRISESLSMPQVGTCLIRPETTFNFSPAPPHWWAAPDACRRVPFAHTLSYTCSDPEAAWWRESYIIPELTHSASQWALLAQAQTSLTQLYGFCPGEGSYPTSLQYSSICPSIQTQHSTPVIRQDTLSLASSMLSSWLFSYRKTEYYQRLKCMTL